MKCDIRQFEPLWGEWKIEKKLGAGNYGQVWEVNNGKETAAVKEVVISLSESKLLEARTEGINEKGAEVYFQEIVNNTLEEVILMQDLASCKNIVNFQDYQVNKINFDKEKGWVILIRMEKLESLKNKIIEERMHINDVIHLGIDICRALEICELKGIIHRDIKPDNLFYSKEKGIYKLGDFGISHYMERPTEGKGRAGTLSHMSPEVYRGDAFTPMADLYALGMILYKLLNDNRIPLLPNFPAPFTPGQRNEALVKRLRGKQPDLPRVVSFEGISEAKLQDENKNGIGVIVEKKDISLAIQLGIIAQKAISALPENRYQSPKELRLELEKLLNLNDVFYEG